MFIHLPSGLIVNANNIASIDDKPYDPEQFATLSMTSGQFHCLDENNYNALTTILKPVHTDKGGTA